MRYIKATALMLLVASAVAGGISPAEAYKYGVNARQERQQDRIYNGVANGSLNPREAARLERQQYALNQREARLRQGGLTQAERYKLERQQNRLSQNIHNQKHDAQGFNFSPAPAPGLGHGPVPGPGPNPANSLFDINKTQANQQNRIYNGIQSGQLTPQEAARLSNQQSRLDAREAQMRADGLTMQERYKLDRQQDRLSRNIYEQKHDAQGMPIPGPVPPQ